MIILGIDPGFAITGYGVVKYEGNKFSTIDYGSITTQSNMELPKRLLHLHVSLKELINKYKPDAVSIEELFFNKNIKTALTVGHGRGVAVLAAAESGVDVFEYTPLQVKQSVVVMEGHENTGTANGEDYTKPAQTQPDDVADATCIAVCHGHSYRMSGLTKG